MPGLAHFCEHLLFMVRLSRRLHIPSLILEKSREPKIIPKRTITPKYISDFLRVPVQSV